MARARPSRFQRAAAREQENSAASIRAAGDGRRGPAASRPTDAARQRHATVVPRRPAPAHAVPWCCAVACAALRCPLRQTGHSNRCPRALVTASLAPSSPRLQHRPPRASFFLRLGRGGWHALCSLGTLQQRDTSPKLHVAASVVFSAQLACIRQAPTYPPTHGCQSPACSAGAPQG